MNEATELASRNGPQDLGESHLGFNTEPQAQGDKGGAQSLRSENIPTPPDARVTTPLPLESSDNMAVDEGADDTSKYGVDTVISDKERGERDVKQLTVLAKLPGPRPTSLSSPDGEKAPGETTKHPHLASEKDIVDVTSAHYSSAPFEPQEEKQMADGAPFTEGATFNDAAPTDSDMAKPMEDVQSSLEDINTEGAVNNDDTIQLDVAAPMSNFDNLSDVSMEFSSPPPELAGKQPTDSENHQVSKEEHQTVQDARSYGMIPAMIQRSQTVVASPHRSHEQAMQCGEARPGSQQPQPSRPILSATEFEELVQIRRLELKTKKHREALAAARAHYEAASASFNQGWSMAPALPAPQSMGLPQQMGPFYNQHAQAAQGYPHVGQQYPTDQYPGHGQMPYSMPQAQWGPNNYAPQGLHGMPPGPMLPGPNGTMNNGQDHQAFQRSQFPTAQEQHEQAQYHVVSSESESEDLPLKLRARPQPFAEQASSSKPPVPPKTFPEESNNPDDSDDTEDPNIDVQPKAIDRSPRALEIDFTLPRYEVQRQPLEGKEDVPSAKVSLPGLVREELLLSPDHADQEVHLLVNLFLPSQQQLETPDAEPATAVLNFHNIAVMVIEAFVQFEIGDEFGTGRGHWHNDHDEDGEGEYMRLRDAKDANPDEIFFAVIDRWRAGIESARKGILLIRGAQEFCDVALDIIYYVKEHGLLKPEPKAKKDKGKAKAVEDQGVEDKGKKRGAQKVVNDVKARKKAKTTPAKAAPAKGKAAKAKVTVSKPVVVVKKKT